MAELKISDLSIGDWVEFHRTKGICIALPLFDKAYAQVIGTHRGAEVSLLVDGKREFMAIPLSAIQPIPITPEILEKNGWSTDGMYAFLRIDEHLHLEYYYHEHRLRKYYCGKDEWQNHAKVNDITFAAHCYSIHQLQHAMRLAGVDKEINL